jgi:hypothetical protein
VTLEIVKKQKSQMQGKVRALRIKPTIADPAKTNVKRARFLAMLSSRYGYTNDKAVDELERLLTQFYKSNKSLGIHHADAIFRDPGAE